ncbi:MAG: DUF3793 family protein [Treponema sp.]|nr:DUF3793 family protein [Treponema sp.]
MLDLDSVFVQHSAPTLCGIKPGNMFSISAENYSVKKVRSWRKEFYKQGVLLKTIRVSDSLILFFVYDFVWIRKILSDSLVKAFLKGKDYPVERGSFAVIKEMFIRLEKSGGFPHEVGIFLGYPLADVIAFEKHDGKNCKYCGYWKAYSNVENAKMCCCMYNNCSRMCKQWFEEGFSLPQIIKEYKKVTEVVA